MKILDSTVSIQDIAFQQRNLEGLYCIYEDALIVQYFGKDFIQEMKTFLKKLPSDSEGVRNYLHAHTEFLKRVRTLFKMLRYSEDQKDNISTELTQLIRQSSKENRCNSEVLYKNTLKTNFLTLLQTELYLKSRYENQLRSAKKFDEVRSSIDLFSESLDKQFPHEYYW